MPGRKTQSSTSLPKPTTSFKRRSSLPGVKTENNKKLKIDSGDQTSSNQNTMNNNPNKENKLNESNELNTPLTEGNIFELTAENIIKFNSKHTGTNTTSPGSPTGTNMTSWTYNSDCTEVSHNDQYHCADENILTIRDLATKFQEKEVEKIHKKLINEEIITKEEPHYILDQIYKLGIPVELDINLLIKKGFKSEEATKIIELFDEKKTKPQQEIVSTPEKDRTYTIEIQEDIIVLKRDGVKFEFNLPKENKLTFYKIGNDISRYLIACPKTNSRLIQKFKQFQGEKFSGQNSDFEFMIGYIIGNQVRQTLTFNPT
jgi:hypothetical protein